MFLFLFEKFRRDFLRDEEKKNYFVIINKKKFLSHFFYLFLSKVCFKQRDNIEFIFYFKKMYAFQNDTSNSTFIKR